MSGGRWGVLLVGLAALGGAWSSPQELRAQTTEELASPPELAPQPAAASDTPPTPEPSANELAAEIAALRSEVARLRSQSDQAFDALVTQEATEPAEALAPALIRVYGFMDFGFDKYFFDDVEDDGIALLRPTPAGTFVFGNLNLYFDARPVERVHTLAEIRFTLAPHGEEISLGPPLGTSYERIDSVAFDFSSPSSQAQMRLGSIYIERAWAEYEVSDLFRVQWGMLLTPFGIWNLDHGSPTLISLILPTFVASQMVPTRLLGVHLYGSAFFGPHEIGYAVHVSNGRSPLDFAMSEDKAVGGRLFWASETAIGRLVLGSSGYIGRYSDKQKAIDIRPDTNLINWNETVAYDEQIVGFDLALDIGDFRLRSEGVLRWVHYRANKHERIFSSGVEEYLPNRLEWDYYALAAYRTPFRIEPYLQWEITRKSYQLPRFGGESRQTPVGPLVHVYSAGFNVELTSHTLFKAQLAYTQITENKIGRERFGLWSVFMRVVTSF